MAWCRQAASHQLSQYWPRYMLHMASLGNNELKQHYLCKYTIKDSRKMTILRQACWWPDGISTINLSKLLRQFALDKSRAKLIRTYVQYFYIIRIRTMSRLHELCKGKKEGWQSNDSFKIVLFTIQCINMYQHVVYYVDIRSYLLDMH